MSIADYQRHYRIATEALARIPQPTPGVYSEALGNELLYVQAHLLAALAAVHDLSGGIETRGGTHDPAVNGT